MVRLLLVGVFLVISTAFPRAQTAAPEASVVIAQGEAIARRAADRAWITIATEVREGKATDARRKSAEAMAAVQTALASVGLPADVIRTTGYSLQPEMGYGYTGNDAGFRAGGGAVAPIDTPFSPGEIEVRAQATVTVAIR
ncbi:MAG TPA: SIMPL domain-containing protein [Vicinamibacterales bacterium]|nr:SIMPL domain-containing protein [Vicinamibacterales bacterium]